MHIKVKNKRYRLNQYRILLFLSLIIIIIATVVWAVSRNDVEIASSEEIEVINDFRSEELTDMEEIIQEDEIILDSEIPLDIETPLDIDANEGAVDETKKTNNINKLTEKTEKKPTEKSENKSTENAQKKTKYYIKVNYLQNAVTIYEADKDGNYSVPVKAMVCSTGTATPTSGVYPISQKYEWGALFGGVYGQYCTRIVRSILFHSVPYVNKYDNGSLEYWEYDKLGTAASAGCVRLTVADAKWIYNNCEAGTKVEFYADQNPGPIGKPVAKKISSEVDFRNWDPTDQNPNNPWRNYKEVKVTEVDKEQKEKKSEEMQIEKIEENKTPESSDKNTSEEIDNTVKEKNLKDPLENMVKNEIVKNTIDDLSVNNIVNETEIENDVKLENKVEDIENDVLLMESNN